MVSAVAVIERERLGYQIDRDAVRQVLRMFTSLGKLCYALSCWTVLYYDALMHFAKMCRSNR